MNIEIRECEDLEGRVQMSLIAEKMSVQELTKLGLVIGKLITMNVKNKANMLAVLKQIYASAGWQIVHDCEAFFTEDEEELSEMLLESYVSECKEEGMFDSDSNMFL